MGGWNIFYGLLNFAILAAALYFIGKKLVVKMFVSRRERIAAELSRAEEALKKADGLESELAQKQEQEAGRRREILAHAREEAEKICEESDSCARQYNEQILLEGEKEKQFFSRTMRRQLNRQAADEIVEAAAAILAEEASLQSRLKLLSAFPAMLEKNFQLSSAEKASYYESGELRAVLCCADEPDEELSENVYRLVLAELQRLDKDAQPCNIHMSVETDPELIGGAMLVLGDTVYDGSLSGMLRRVKNKLGNTKDLDGDVLDVMENILRSADREIDVYQLGHVVSLGDGICHVSGVSDAMYGELLEFGGDLVGLVMDLEKDYVGVALLGNYDHVREGDPVRRSGHVVEVPVGEELLGRVVDALGRPIDGGDELSTSETRPIECAAPGVIQRKSVHKPMQTGIKAIDALVPIGRGQRELIIGDRQTGKTAIALDTIINQKGKDMICIYVAIGQKESTVVGLVEKLREKGCMDYTIVVCAAAYEAAPMLYIAPYAGTSMGEYFMNKGKDVLIIYDDLSKHAVAYREISLLLHRPPGREAYPGDIFYLHSRLLERAASLSDECGGGSMTALPIVETQAGDISAYIPTNVISITDGQIFLETELFNSGSRPAINVGLSVSRVGGAAQLPAMKQVSGRLRMDLAQYRELAAFSQFGSELDKNTRDVLNRGAHISELLKQGQYAPVEAWQQVVAIFAAGEGFADDIPLHDMARYEQQLLGYVTSSYPQLQDDINGRKKLSNQQLDTLRGLIAQFNKTFH